MALLGHIRKRASETIVKVIFGLIALSFVVGFGILPNIGGPDRRKSIVIEAGKTQIEASEFMNAYRQALNDIERAYGGQVSKEILESLGLKTRIVESLKLKAILLEQARIWGLRVPDSVLNQEVQKVKAFQTEGRFDPQRYQAVLRASGIRPESFESAFKEDILAGWVEQLLAGLAVLPEPAVRLAFEAMNHRRSFYAIELKEPQISPESLNEDQLRAFYGEHKEDFRVPKRVQCDLLAFEPLPLLSQVHPDPQTIQAYYQAHIEEFKEPKRWHIAQILLSNEAQAKEIRKKLLDGEPFEELAKAFSEDEASAKKGGDVGPVRAEALNPAVRKEIFRLKEGEVSNPIRIGQQFVLIKLVNILPERTPELEEVRGIIEEILKRHQAKNLAKSRAKEAFLNLQAMKNPDIEEYAKTHGVRLIRANLNKPDQAIEGLGYYPELNKRLLMLTQGELIGPIETTRGYYVAVGSKVIPSHIPDFDALKDKIRVRLLEELNQQKRASLFSELSKAFSSTQDIEGQARQRGLVLHVLSPVSWEARRLEPLGEVSPELVSRLFKLTKKAPVFPEPVSLGKQTYLLILKEVLPPDMEAYTKDRAQTLAQLQQELRGAFVSRFVEAFEKEHPVKIHEEVLGEI